MYAIARRGSRPRSRISTVAVPYLGWNTRDYLADMEPVFAQDLMNFYPENGRLKLRGGRRAHASGIMGGVQTLMEYSGTGGRQMLAVGAGAVYNATNGGTLTTDNILIKNLASARLDWEMFGTLGTTRLLAVNGVDGWFYYDGTTFQKDNAAITGVDATTLKGVMAHKGRLWAFQKSTTSLWYLPAGQFVGAMTEYPVGSLMSHGGTISAIATWTRDGGSGSDDYFVVVGTEGDVLVYGGTDPASASTWGLVGQYKIAKPVGGTRGVVKRGNTVAILTRDGVRDLDEVMTGQAGEISLSDRINPTFRARAETRPGHVDWQIIRDESKARTIINVPAVADTRHQFVYCEQPGAWTRLEGQNASCWGTYDGTLYFGAKDGFVYEADAEISDEGSAIAARVIFAPSNFGTPSEKHFKRANVHFLTDGTPNPSVDVVLDYDQPANQPATTDTTASGSTWDVAPWDTSSWSDIKKGLSVTRGLGGKSQFGALRVALSVLNAELSITGAKVTFEVGREL